MGNKASGPESSGYSHERDELEYSTPAQSATSDSASPATQLKRSQTLIERTPRPDVPIGLPRTSSDAGSLGATGHTHRSDSSSALSTSPSFSTPITNATDKLADHIIEAYPNDGDKEVDLGTTIVVTFDKDVRTVNVNKLFEVFKFSYLPADKNMGVASTTHDKRNPVTCTIVELVHKCKHSGSITEFVRIQVECESLDPSFNPVKGRVSYDARSQRAEFTPQNTLFPNASYTVTLLGKAVTTTQCSNGSNISNMTLHFMTCNPAPKNVGIKLRGDEEPETLQIANYYDLYNSLIVWSTKKWGCSGEHVTGLYHENEQGKLFPLKADHDVLGVNENGVIVVEIKD